MLKLADNVKDEGTLSSRSLQTPQELLLFYRLLAAHGDDAEGLRIFRDERLGPKSKIAKDEWVFRRKQIDLLGKRNDWQGLFDTTYELLSNSRANNEAGAIIDARGADWLVWKEFLRAVSELQTEK
jgi:N-terminal acetyltransferase B complex non-catalytic subunit